MLIKLYNDIGFKIDYFFSNLTELTYQNGNIYVTGRDLVVFISGALCMLVLMVLMISIRDTFRRKR